MNAGLTAIRMLKKRKTPPAVPTESTHEQLERDHNRAEHERHEHAHGTEWDSVDAADTFEPWADYDLGVMPRGV